MNVSQWSVDLTSISLKFSSRSIMKISIHKWNSFKEYKNPRLIHNCTTLCHIVILHFAHNKKLKMQFIEALPEIERLLSNLWSEDNSIRSQSEAELNTLWVEQRPHIILPALVHFISQHQDPKVSYDTDIFHSGHPHSLALNPTLFKGPFVCLCLDASLGNQGTSYWQTWR